MRHLFSQILTEIKEAPDDLKASILQTNDTPMLRQLLLMTFDPTIVFDVPIPVYRDNTETDGYSSNSLYVEYRRMYLFLTTYTKISPTRKSTLLAQILESIDVSDAPCLIDVIKKDLSMYGLTKEIVNDAFPGLVKS